MKSYVLKLDQRINNWVTQFNKFCIEIASKNYFTNVYGFSRSLLAIGTLLTLISNDSHILFPEHLFSKFKLGHFLENINLFFLLGYDNIWIAELIAIVILLSVVIGVYPRITGILHWWISFSFFTAGIIVDGGDQVTSVITLLLIPVTLLDSRKNHWYKPKENNQKKNFIAFVVFVIIELQVAIIYLLAGIEKPFKVPEWVDGTAVYYWLNHNVFGTSEFLLKLLNPLMDYSTFISAMTWGTIIFEISLFGLFFMNREKRHKFLKLGIAFHLMIILFHGLVSFFFAMAAALTLYLVSKDFSFNLQRDKFFKLNKT